MDVTAIEDAILSMDTAYPYCGTELQKRDTVKRVDKIKEMLTNPKFIPNDRDEINSTLSQLESLVAQESINKITR